MLNLRVALATADVSWTNDFLLLGGMDCLEKQLSRLIVQDATPGAMYDKVLADIVKCLRVLLNTDVSDVCRRS